MILAVLATVYVPAVSVHTGVPDPSAHNPAAVHVSVVSVHIGVPDPSTYSQQGNKTYHGMASRQGSHQPHGDRNGDNRSAYTQQALW